ncbi:MAG: TIM barrel protein [Planctomycetes bacterium]|nr:TIM barrel protein [Planctomycetota bacterium]
MANWPVGTQLYVFMQTYGKEGRKLEDNVDDTLGQIARAGYSGFEAFLGLLDTREKAAALRPLLEKHRLRMPSCYAGGSFLTLGDAEKSISTILRGAEIAAGLGVSAINNNPSPIGRDKTDGEIRVQCANLNRLGAELKKLGMKLHVHNHDPEIRNGAKEFRASFQQTDPDLVGLCVDTHWIYRGGMDPLALMKECGPRIQSLHIRNSVDGVWTEKLGDGDVDYRPIQNFLGETGYRGWLLVELAIEPKTVFTRPLAENMKLSREYVRGVFQS